LRCRQPDGYFDRLFGFYRATADRVTHLFTASQSDWRKFNLDGRVHYADRIGSRDAWVIHNADSRDHCHPIHGVLWDNHEGVSMTTVNRSLPKLRDYTFLGTTQSLCPDCLSVVPTKIIVRNDRVYFRKTCKEHGVREDFICSDVNYYDRMEYSLPAKLPHKFAVEPKEGCPHDCGLCTEHEQHTCIALLEITSSCNLSCPMCFASSGPGGKHLSLEECKRTIDRLVEAEGQPEVFQLSGGEPTIHPEFNEILEYAVEQPIDYITINTNGIRFAHDKALVDLVAKHKKRVEVYLQLDGLNDIVNQELRGESLLETKLKAIERLGEAGIHITLAVTLQGGVNDDQMGPLVDFALERPWITGMSFQPATYSGRHVLPEQLEQRITFPDVVKGIASQSSAFEERDFMPLPCAHPNCHWLTYCYRGKDQTIPLTRFMDMKDHLDLLANGITFTRPRARNVMLQYLGRMGCCGTDDELSLPVVDGSTPSIPEEYIPAAMEFFDKAVNQTLGAEDVFRITITSFLDAYNFDLRRLMKCCTHHVLPSGHTIPFCAYNVLYREGHVAMPELPEDWVK